MKRRSRKYIVTWNWSHDDDGAIKKRDEIQATTAIRAWNKLRRQLSEEYAGVNDSTVIVHEIVLAD